MCLHSTVRHTQSHDITETDTKIASAIKIIIASNRCNYKMFPLRRWFLVDNIFSSYVTLIQSAY